MKTFSCAAPWFRRGEIALWVIGLSHLGWALVATLVARVYQARQDRALSPGMKRDPATRVGVDPLVLGRIEIPRIGVMAIVRERDDDTTLASRSATSLVRPGPVSAGTWRSPGIGIPFFA